MNLKKILLITKIFLLTLVVLSFSVASASEITGTLTSGGVASPTSTVGGTEGGISGTVTGGSTVGGTIGGGGTGISGTVTGGANGPIVTSNSGGGGGGNSGAIVASSNGSPQNQTTFQNSTNDNLNTAGLQNFANGLAQNDENITGLTQGDVAVLAENQGNTNPNSNQFGAAVASGIGLSTWIWWLFLILVLLAIGYYIYTRFENRDERRKY